MKRVTWSPRVAVALKDTADDGHAYMQERIGKGDAEVWETDGGFLITEVFPDLLFIWCYQGRDFVPLLRRLARVALDNGLSTVGWFTRHTAPLRLFRAVRGTIQPTDVPGEFRYILSAEDLWQLEKTLPDRLRSARLAVTTSTLATRSAVA